MIEAFKYVRNLYRVSSPKLKLSENKKTRGSVYKLDKPLAGIQVRSGYFSERIVNTWNSLPDCVVTAPTVNAFKNRLDRYWKNDPGKFVPECLQQRPCTPPKFTLLTIDEQTQPVYNIVP